VAEVTSVNEQMSRHVSGSEQAVRERIQAFVERLNQAPLQALLLQQLAHTREPERYADPIQEENIPEERRHPGARDLALVFTLIRNLVAALDQDDEATLRKAVEGAQGYLEDVVVKPRLSAEKGTLRVIYKDRTEGREFFATALLLEFLDYVQNYAHDIKLGICRHCGKVFVKPKHGAQAIYCSRSCTQKAYRARKKQREVMEDDP